LPNRKSRLHKRIGKIEVRLLDPSLWAIGKLARFLPTDIEDLIHVLQKTKPDIRSLARLWGRALRQSPPSSSQGQFRQHVEYFFERHARAIWGKAATPEELKTVFLKSARNANIAA